jgi:predicted RNA polymerase sigma factor
VKIRLAEAHSEFKAAATLTRHARERAFLLARAERLRLQTVNSVAVLGISTAAR